MVVFMAGLPQAGKTTCTAVLVDRLREMDVDHAVIEPKSMRPEDYDDLPEFEKRQCDLDAWAVSLDVLMEQMECCGSGDVLIYDTACASLRIMSRYFRLARRFRHAVLYAYVKCPVEECVERGKDFLTAETMDRYREKMLESIPELSRMADVKVFLDGTTEPDVDSLVSAIMAVRKGNAEKRISEHNGQDSDIDRPST